MSEEPLTALVEPDPLYFDNCYPDPNEEFQNGGWPGVRYMYTAVHRQKQMIQNGWWLVPNAGKVYTVSGPAGTMDCVVMGLGEPIRGADPSNGTREWYIDPELEDGTGVLADPKGRFGEPKPESKPKQATA